MLRAFCAFTSHALLARSLNPPQGAFGVGSRETIFKRSASWLMLETLIFAGIRLNALDNEDSGDSQNDMHLQAGGPCLELVFAREIGPLGHA